MGPIITDWNENRVIRPHVKRAAAIGIVLIMTPALVFGSFPIAAKAVSAFIGFGVIVMIYARPSRA
jgi:hypothetical protein